MQDQQWIFATALSIAETAGNSTIGTDVVYLPQGVDHTDTAELDRTNVSGKNFLNIIVDTEDMLAAIDGSIVTFELYNDTDSVPTTGGDVIITKAITANTPTDQPIGTQILSIPLPSGPLKPYFNIKVSVATQDLSTGKVSAWIGPQTQQGK